MTKQATMTPQQKEFAKLKKYVDKRAPGAHVQARQVGDQMWYALIDGKGQPIVDPDLLIPPARSVREAWEQAKYCAWFSNMIRKSNAAFCDEKIFRSIAKERGGDD